ncbi:MAG: response regulator [Lachnospiraceae bacterium]|nr:response regulator [Lachnospiraceae bacterium]
MWLKIVPGIDLVAGVLNCGSAEDYLDALYIFYSSIEEKAEELAGFLEEEEWTMYALRVHSLKSMARIIGAKKLGETAAFLEEAAGNEQYELVKKRNPNFLRSFRSLIGSLSPIAANGELPHPPEEKPEEPVKEAPVRENVDHSHSVLCIHNGDSVVKKGLENHLTTAGFEFVSIPDEPDRIIAYRNGADIVVYCPMTNEKSHTALTMNLLAEICQDDAKIFCLAGDADELEKAMSASGSHRISRRYERPVDIGLFIRDMRYFSALEEDYHRRKTIFVVDDDPGFLTVTSHWLSDEYHVSCFQSGDEAIKGLNTVTPDLILLDYEMPDMDGFTLMKNIRTNFPDTKIPIIFLTGKNDRELVFQVPEYKPDGYLLKTSGKDTLLDVIRRFFTETLFKQSLCDSQGTVTK